MVSSSARTRLLATLIAALSVPSCGGDTVDPTPVCAKTQLVPVDPMMVTATGRVLAPLADSWAIRQLDADGSLSAVATVPSSGSPLAGFGWLEHDPLSGRMWLVESWWDETPSVLHQLDADGEIEWTVELVDYERGATANSLHYDDGALYLALSLDQLAPDPDDPEDPGTPGTLVVERRDLDGAVVWTRSDYTPPNTHEWFASARLVGVSDGALSMVATPPLIDYGSSYPLTLAVGTGEVLWSGAEGHDPLRMAVSDDRLYLGWGRGRVHDDYTKPEPAVVEPSMSTLSVHAPSTGAEARSEILDWPAIDWGASGVWDGRRITLGWMGPQLLLLVQGRKGEHGLAIYDEAGVLVCQGVLDREIRELGRGVGIEGRAQFVVEVGGPSDDDPRALLLVEPL